MAVGPPNFRFWRYLCRSAFALLTYLDSANHHILTGKLIEQPDKAIVDYTLAIKLYPEFPPLYLHRSEAYRFKQNYRAAIKDAELDVELDPIEKWDFYKAVDTTDHVLTIQTADQQRFANLLLAVGVRMDG